MTPRSLLPCLFLVALSSLPPPLVPAAQPKDKEKPADLKELLEEIRKEYELPAMVGAVVQGDKIIAEGAVGVREIGKKDRVTLDDRFQIGSCTKRITSVMVCRVIDAGKLGFDTKLADALPKFKMLEEYRAVTVGQLLASQAGMAPYREIDPSLTPVLFDRKGSVAERRTRFLAHLLLEKPVAKPGTGENFSNASFFVAAELAARRSGRSWEALVGAEVFKPLGMTRSGFGRARNKERPKEPAVHVKKDDVYVPGPQVELPAETIMAAPANVHASIRDLARFASHELAAARGYDRLLKPATAKFYQDLPPGPGKAEVAVFGKSGWSQAAYVYWPAKNVAAAVAVNAGESEEACRKFLTAVRKRYVDPEK
jgi:CubicO group peptidase (beta-lactamase class C family)